MGTRNGTSFKPGGSGNTKGGIKGRSITSWLKRHYDEEVDFSPEGQAAFRATRGEAFARWLAKAIVNPNEEVGLRTTALRYVLDRIDPILVDGGITQPDFKIMIVNDAPKAAELIEVKAVKGLPTNGTNRNGRNRHG